MWTSEATERVDEKASGKGAWHWPLLFYGVFLVLFGLAAYLTGVFLSFPRLLLGSNATLLKISEWLVWYSGTPVLFGSVIGLVDLFVLLPRKRAGRKVLYLETVHPDLTVVLTAYNDEESIGPAVEDFVNHPKVKRVIVVSNNSTDQTESRAKEAGAIVINETQPGYGRCVYRCLSEGIRYEDTSLVLLCEGDRTFRASDIDKFLAYIPHATIVNGTRIVEQLREYRTQLSTFMYYGNFFVGKLLEVKHLGKGTFTDVGTTYKLCRAEALKRLLPRLDPSINLEFNAYFLDQALAFDETVIECPITFFPRVGESKGGNVDNRRALKVGSRMILGLLSDWCYRARA